MRDKDPCSGSVCNANDDTLITNTAICSVNGTEWMHTEFSIVLRRHRSWQALVCQQSACPSATAEPLCMRDLTTTPPAVRDLTTAPPVVRDLTTTPPAVRELTTTPPTTESLTTAAPVDICPGKLYVCYTVIN